MSIVSAVVLCTLVGAVGAIILVAASKFMAVEEDPRIVATLSKAWRGVVWYMREISGEARYDHYLEHFAAEHPDERPLSEKEFLLAREAYDREHPNTSCCC